MSTLDVDGHTLKVSNLDKVLFPQDGTTKYDVIQHYLVVSGPLLAQLRGRPATRKRWPNGVEADSFFEKNIPRGTPDWVRTVKIDSPGSTKDRTRVIYPILDSEATLVWVANLAALELHTPQWSVDGKDKVQGADRLVIDLDPGAPATLTECVAAARLVRERLESDGYTCIPVTSGSKGMQLYASRGGSESPDTLREYAHELAKSLESDEPDLVLSNMKRTMREGKVLLDWSQNSHAKTTITPYSLRGRARSWVAAPRTWDELEDVDSIEQIHRTQMPKRLDAYGDLMAELP